jgi:hypothetical protein
VYAPSASPSPKPATPQARQLSNRRPRLLIECGPWNGATDTSGCVAQRGPTELQVMGPMVSGSYMAGHLIILPNVGLEYSPPFSVLHAPTPTS